eukprot:2693920-Rhodomonas_salina.2
MSATKFVVDPEAQHGPDERERERKREKERGGKARDAANQTKTPRAEKQTDATHGHAGSGITDRRSPQITQDDPPLSYPGLFVVEIEALAARTRWKREIEV